MRYIVQGRSASQFHPHDGFRVAIGDVDRLHTNLFRCIYAEECIHRVSWKWIERQIDLFFPFSSSLLSWGEGGSRRGQKEKAYSNLQKFTASPKNVCNYIFYFLLFSILQQSNSSIPTPLWGKGGKPVGRGVRGCEIYSNMISFCIVIGNTYVCKITS